MAASAGAVRAGRAFVELFADDSKLVRGLKRAQQKLRAFGAGVRSLGTRLLGVGTAAVAPLLAAVGKFAAAGDQLDKMSARTGASVEALSALGFAAEQSGSSLDAVGNALFRMRRRIANAATASGPAVRALQELGLSAEELARLPADQQLLVLADRLGKVENESLAAQFAFELFGDGAKSLLPLLAQGADGIEALMEEARELGIVMSGPQAKSAAEFTDAWNRVKRQLGAVIEQIGAQLAPLLTEFLGRVKTIVRGVIDWAQENGPLLRTIFKIGLAVMAAGAALIAAGIAITGLSAVLGGVASAFTLLGTVLGALLSPIGAVIAAVGALATWLVTSTDVGAQALGWLGEKFQALKATALKAWQGIADALAAGDIGLAAKILWLTLKVEWKKGVHTLNQLWVKVKEFFLSVWTEAVFGAARIATNAWAGLQAAWTETVDFLMDAWTLFTTGLTKTWNTAVGFIRKAWVKLKSLFDSETDADQEVARINEEIAGKNRAAEEERDRRIFEREQRRRQRLSEIEGQRTGTLEELERQREAEHARRRQQFESDLAKSENALSQARREWQQAIEEAARKRKEAEEDEGPERAKKPGDLLDRLQDELAGLGEGLRQTQDKVSVTGTFSAAAVRGLSGGSAADRTARATEETAKNTKRILDEARHGGLVFS